MIDAFVKKFNDNRENIKKDLMNTTLRQTYIALFRLLCVYLSDEENEWDFPDPKRIEHFGHGDYQGTDVFAVACGGYQPRQYWITYVDYGSCSGCDTLCAVNDLCEYNYITNGYDVTMEAADRYLVIMLHMLQRMKPMREDA